MWFAKAAAAFLVSSVLTITAPVPAEAKPRDVLSDISYCESRNRNVLNTQGSTASGYFQITNGTWKDFGGSRYAPTAIQASKAEQTVIARKILNKRGTQPWNASRACWSKR